jgi:hypothetical protein
MANFFLVNNKYPLQRVKSKPGALSLYVVMQHFEAANRRKEYFLASHIT